MPAQLKVGDKVFVDMGRVMQDQPLRIPHPHGAMSEIYFAKEAWLEARVNALGADSATLELRAEGVEGQIVDSPLALIKADLLDRARRRLVQQPALVHQYLLSRRVGSGRDRHRVNYRDFDFKQRRAFRNESESCGEAASLEMQSRRGIIGPGHQ